MEDEAASLQQEMDEVERQTEELNRQIEELKREAEEVNRQTEELKRQREEEQREIEGVNRQIDESHREEQIWQAQRQQRLRSAQPLTFPRYLEACHSLDAAIQVRPPIDPWYASEDDLSNPKVHPRQIVPSPDFVTKQLEIWHLLSESDTFSSEAVYPCLSQLGYVRSMLRRITCDFSLYCFERDAVDYAIETILSRVYNDPLLLDTLGLLGE
jgi:hypothetical protein